MVVAKADVIYLKFVDNKPIQIQIQFGHSALLTVIQSQLLKVSIKQ